eukprot:3898865-Lingulodinium_polyedra.AAC.1
MDISEDPLAPTIQQLPEFEVDESDVTVIIYPIPEGIDLVKLHTIVGRFGEFIDFDGGGDAGSPELGGQRELGIERAILSPRICPVVR